MLPVVTPEQMAAIDDAAPEPVDVLIGRAGAAVGRTALAMLGGAYGRRVTVLHGPGNNGADGLVGGRWLARRGVRVRTVDATASNPVIPVADLVIDAAFGTGLSRPYDAPDPGEALVLAVDIPSGVSGRTGDLMGSPMPADATVTFAALKPGLLFHPGAGLTGEIHVADIGLDVSRADIGLVTGSDVVAMVPVRSATAHKWQQAVLVVGGSQTMTGAPHLAAAAAQRAGVGMVRLAIPGVVDDPGRPIEAVGVDVSDTAWADELTDHVDRVGAVVIGPGLGRSMVARHQIRTFLSTVDVPTVVDGDGLTAMGHDAPTVLAGHTSPVVLTPHDGEFEHLTGHRPTMDRIGDTRALALATGATVLLKGPTTVVAAPSGRVRLVDEGDSRLATAGTGDVLSGIIGAFLAAGMPELDAAAVAAFVHARAGRLGPPTGLVASDLVDHIPAALSGDRP